MKDPKEAEARANELFPPQIGRYKSRVIRQSERKAFLKCYEEMQQYNKELMEEQMLFAICHYNTITTQKEILKVQEWVELQTKKH